MKITNPEVIRNAEKELMDAITGDLDWGSIEKVFRERHNMAIEEDVEYRRGDIVVHNSEIAFRLEFIAKVTVSVLLDRDGNYISVNSTGPAGGDGVRENPPATGFEDVLGQYARDEGPEKLSVTSAPSAEIDRVEKTFDERPEGTLQKDETEQEG